MSNLTAKFTLIDEMSSKLDSMADSGEQMLDSWDKAGQAVNSAMSGISSSVSSAVSSVDGVASSFESAADSTDYWTSAVGNYDKGLMEAVYSTEELVNSGYKVQQALDDEQAAFEMCDKQAESLNRALEATTDIETGLSEAISNAEELSKQFSDTEGELTESQQQLQSASEAAAAALEELMYAQEEAQEASQYLADTVASGTTDLDELEIAAEQACHASEALAEANGKATEATEELEKATESASKEAEDSGKTGVEAIEAIAGALEAAGITKTVTEISNAAYEMAEAFSDAESTVVKATGATGETLDGLSESMMNAYEVSKTGSLDETAAAVGEINTRLAYTGDILTDTTEDFLDFASATGGNAASSVRSVTQLMRQWDIDNEDLTLTLDKLTYAGQATGISVDSLSSQLTSNKAILDQLGYSLDESIAMFGNFELAGTNASAVMTGFRTALSNGSIESLDDLNEIFDEIAAGEMSAADAADIFGARAGTTIVNAVKTGVFSLDELVTALENSGGTLETTVETAQTMEEKWEQATNNVGAAFQQALSPALEEAQGEIAGVVNNIGTFLNEHPNVTKALTATAVGLGVVVTAFAAFTIATTVGTTVVGAFTTALTAMNAALGPVGWVVLGFTAVTTAVAAYSAMQDDATDVTERLTASSQEQADELAELNEEYDRVCEEYGKGSDEAMELRGRIELLTDSFNDNKQTIGGLLDNVDQLGSKLEEIQTTYDNAVTSSDELADNSTGLIAELTILASNSTHTTAELGMMNSIVDKLNGTYDGLNLTLDETNGKLNMSTQELWETVTEENAAEKAQANVDALVGFIGQYQDAQSTLQEANETMKAAWDEYERAVDEDFADDHPFLAWTGWADGAEMNWSGSAKDAWQAWEVSKEAADGAREKFNGLEESIRSCYEEMGYSSEEIDNMISELAASSTAASELADSLDQTTEVTIGYEDAAKEAFDSVQTEVENLVTAYNEAYDAARSSIDSSIGLFQQMSLECETSTQDMIAALESQTEYLNQYSENLKQAAEYGLDEGLIASLSDGSEESAAYLDTIISKIDELGGSTEEAKAFVDQMNTSFEDVETAKDTFAETVADMQTNFDEEMGKLVDTMEQTVEDLGLDTEAAAAATSTIQAYADAITAQKGAAVEAATAVANAVSQALSSTTVTTSTSSATTVPGHASGTTDAEDVFVAGEDGPELIVGKSGSTVFPTEETERIVNAVQQQPLYVPAPESYSSDDSQQEQGSTASSEKKITLEIAGSGSVNVGAGTTKEQVLELLYNNIKPALMNIISTEIYEEGELAYDF